MGLGRVYLWATSLADVKCFEDVVASACGAAFPLALAFHKEGITAFTVPH